MTAPTTYKLGNPKLPYPFVPCAGAFNTDPTTSNLYSPIAGGPYQVGTVWVNKTLNRVWMLTSVTANIPNWESVTGNDTKQLIVDNNSIPNAAYGLYSTIQSAIDAAAVGQTILINPGTYTENLNLKAGVNLAAYGNSGFTPTVRIIGKISYNQDGFVTLSGIGLQTNGNYCLSVTGSAVSRVYLTACNITAEDFAAIEMTTTGVGSSIRIVDSWCRTNAVATNFFVCTGVGGLTFWNVNVIDGGATAQSTPSTFASTGQLLVKYSIIRFPITTSGTGRISGTCSEFNTFATNSIPLVVNATGAGGTLGNYVRGCIFLSGNTSALSVGSGATLNMEGNSVITTSSTPFTGTGTINQSGTSYSNSTPVTSSTTVTLARKAFDPGALYGNWSGVAPSAGFVGEYIYSKVASGSAVTINPSGTIRDVTSIVLTPGTWDVSGVVQFTNIPAAAGTSQVASVNNVSATLGTYGDNTVSATFTNTVIDDVGIAVPAYRVNVSPGGTTTMYLVATATYTGGSSTRAYGRISATRVA